MSYILDALRKSDQQRQRGAAPTLLAGQATTIAARQNFPLGYGLFAIALVAAGIFIGWLRPWQSEPATRAAQPAIATSAETSPRQATPSPAATAPAQSAEPPLATTPPLAQPTLPLQPAPAPAAIKAVVRAPAEREPRSAPQRNPDSAPPRSGAALAAPVPVVILMAELPVAIQQELPPMSVSVHAYSGKPKDRLVGINNRLLHQGDSLAPGLTLEQITPDGMIFSYKGYTFRRGVQ